MCDLIAKHMVLAHCSEKLPSSNRGNLYLRTDATCRRTAKRCEASSVAAGGTKLLGNDVSENNSRDNAKPNGVITERNGRYDNNERLGCGMTYHKQRDCPQNLRFLDLWFF